MNKNNNSLCHRSNRIQTKHKNSLLIP